MSSNGALPLLDGAPFAMELLSMELLAIEMCDLDAKSGCAQARGPQTPHFRHCALPPAFGKRLDAAHRCFSCC
jgi:hypothetical protein